MCNHPACVLADPPADKRRTFIVRYQGFVHCLDGSLATLTREVRALSRADARLDFERAFPMANVLAID